MAEFDGFGSCEPGDRVVSGLLVEELFGDGGVYQSVCTCSDTSNAPDLEAAQRQAEATLNFTILMDAFANLDLGAEFNCQNQCATCFPGGTSCGVFRGTNVTRLQGLPTTLDDLLAISSMGADADPETNNRGLPLEGGFDTELCLEYAAGDHAGDTLCWGASLAFVPFAGGQEAESELPCFVRYNGEECQSCLLVGLSDGGCLKADCSNLEGETELVDTCADDPQKAGKFQPLFYFEDPSQLTADCSTSSAATPTSVLVASASCGLLAFLAVGLL